MSVYVLTSGHEESEVRCGTCGANKTRVSLVAVYDDERFDIGSVTDCDACGDPLWPELPEGRCE